MTTSPVLITSLLAGFMAFFMTLLNIIYTFGQTKSGGDVFKNVTDGIKNESLNRLRYAYLNAAFNVPMSIFLLGLIELNSASRAQLIVLALVLILCRILHAVGSYFESLQILRTFGDTTQFGYYIVSGIWLLSNAYFLLSIK
jgi:uncharacterized membrane protein YecN with MAPEG domain